MSPKRISDGKVFWRNNQAALVYAAEQYNVPANVIAAIVGIETNYGTNAGSFRLADSLTTLAFNYPRRAEFFRGELTEFLLLAKEERRDPLTLKAATPERWACHNLCPPAIVNGRLIWMAMVSVISGIILMM